MNKGDLTRRISELTSLTQKDSKIVLEAVLQGIEEGLVEDSRVSLTNFATIETRVRDEYQGHNPSTGEPMTIPSANVVRFRPSQALKDKINK